MVPEVKKDSNENEQLTVTVFRKNKVRYRLLALILAIGTVSLSGGYALASGQVTFMPNQTIYACVTGVNGNITKVSNFERSCPKGTSAINWNSAGPKGDQGIRGLKGDPGTGVNQNAHMENDLGQSPGAIVPGFGSVQPSSEEYYANSGALYSAWTRQFIVHVVRDGLVYAVDPRTGSYLSTDFLQPDWKFFTNSTCEGSGLIHDEGEMLSRSNPQLIENQVYLFFDHRKFYDAGPAITSTWQEKPIGLYPARVEQSSVSSRSINSFLNQRGGECISRFESRWDFYLRNQSHLTLDGKYFEVTPVQLPQPLGPLHWVG